MKLGLVDCSTWYVGGLFFWRTMRPLALSMLVIVAGCWIDLLKCNPVWERIFCADTPPTSLSAASIVSDQSVMDVLSLVLLAAFVCSTVWLAYDASVRCTIWYISSVQILAAFCKGLYIVPIFWKLVLCVHVRCRCWDPLLQIFFLDCFNLASAVRLFCLFKCKKLGDFWHQLMKCCCF